MGTEETADAPPTVQVGAGVGPDAPQEKQTYWEVIERGPQAPEHIEKRIPAHDLTVESTEYIRLRLHNLSLVYGLHRAELPEFEFMGRQWRFLFFPKGNTADIAVSLYLDYARPKEDPSWGLCLQFVLTAHSEDDALTQQSSREAHHRFTMSESDWGFPTLVKRAQFYTDEAGKRFVVDDSMEVSVYAQLIRDDYGTLWNNFLNYDSKKMTGYVGLKNQGATCYMNSILQSLYFTNSFRKAVYQIPVGGQDDKEKAVTYALQRVFYQLQTGNEPVGTTELTKSFGWDVVESFMQHDVQEFNRVLCDNLENKMKGTTVEGTVAKLLEGRYKMYIRCINVDYESSRVEPFYDIQLNVKGLKTLEDSFKDYIQVETMDGENKYMAEGGYGLQDAKKGVIFERFPPVLHLQLKRFEYDFQRDANVKINDRHEFPLKIDLRPFMSNPEDQPEQVYHLHGVLVHSGDSHGGHYCAFIRPEPNGNWFKFDDDRVTRCSAKEAMDDNFGVEPEALDPKLGEVSRVKLSRKYTNAYMLVYIRETELNEVLCKVGEEAVPKGLVDRINREKEEQLRLLRKSEEEHLSMDVRIVTEETIRENPGLDLFTRKPLNQPSSGVLLRVRKDKTLSEFRVQIEEDFKIPRAAQRYWVFALRQNQTYRPDEPLVNMDDVTMEQIRYHFKQKAILNLFLERPAVAPSAMATTSPTKYLEPLQDKVLLFIKNRYEFVTSLFARANDRPLDVMERVAAMLNVPAKQSLRRTMLVAADAAHHQVWEEVSSTQIEEIRPKRTFKELEISIGDILIIQRDLSAEQMKQYAHPTPRAYVEYLINRQVVRFRARDAPRDAAQGFDLELSLKMPYDDVARAVGNRLKTDPMKLRFYTHRVQPDGPFNIVARSAQPLLEQMLTATSQYSNATDILYYEKLEISIVEMENKIVKVVSWMNANRQEEAPINLLLEKTDLVSALFEQVKAKVALRNDTNKKLKTSPSDAATAQLAPVEEAPSAPLAANGTVTDRMDTSPSPATALSTSSEDPMITSEDESASPQLQPIGSRTPADDDKLEEEQGTGQFRLYEVYNGKPITMIDPNKLVAQLPAYDQYVVEEIPADQLKLDSKDRLVFAVHFHRDVYSLHGLPFLFRLQAGETAGALKRRLRQALGLSEKEFNKYKVAHLIRGEKIEYLSDGRPIYA